jgi:hypothetical protein
MLGRAVGALHVARAGCLGGICCDMMFLRGVSIYKLSVFSKELWVAGEGSDAIETVSSGRHGRGGNSDSLLGAVGARLGGWWGYHRLRGQGSEDVVGRAAVDGILVKDWLCMLMCWAGWGWHWRWLIVGGVEAG